MRAGLARCGIDTVFANDVDESKAALYRENWGDSEFLLGDVRDLRGKDIPCVEVDFRYRTGCPSWTSLFAVHESIPTSVSHAVPGPLRIWRA